jgi:hypothetical protein
LFGDLRTKNNDREVFWGENMPKTQPEQVIEKMRELGGYATFGQLNQALDFSLWKTKTPQASVRRIVQKNEAFSKIKPGLWALKEYKALAENRFGFFENMPSRAQNDSLHTYYQWLTVEIGNMYEHVSDTYVPNQDKNKVFSEKKALGEISTLENIHNFTNPTLLKRVKTIDVVWFNFRDMPHSFFEVEHSTDFRNSLTKYVALQDFRTRFFIISDASRMRQFQSVIDDLIYKDIRKRTKFVSYQQIDKQYEKMSGLREAQVI